MPRLIPQLFRRLSPQQIALQDLDEARRALLVMQAESEYAAKMVEYYKGLVKRLELYTGATPNATNN